MLKIIKKIKIKKYNKVTFRQNDFGRVREYNCKGGLLYLEEPKKRIWRKYTLDEHAHPIYSIDSNGIEQWFEYDNHGHMIHLKCSDGFEIWKTFDTKGNCLYYHNSKGETKWGIHQYKDGVYIGDQIENIQNGGHKNGKHKMETF